MTSTSLNLPWPARVGRSWFQWRSFSPVPLFLLLVILPSEFVPSASEFILLLFGVFFAELIRILAVGFAGSVTRTRGDSIPELIHAGPFRYVRNPLYLANILMYTLAGLIFGSTTLAFIIFLYSALQYTFIVAYEEERLLDTFGEAYDDYRKKVSRWVPSVVPSIDSSGHRFDMLRALRSERSTFYSLSAMGLLYFLKVAIHS